MRHGYSRLSSSLFLTAVLAGAATIGCASAPRGHEREERREHDRFYDRHHGDHHAWNESEDRAYRQFLAERRREYRDFFKLKDKEQRDYWTWRHSHSDDDHDGR